MVTVSEFASALMSRGFLSKIISGKTIEALSDFVEELFSGGLISYEDYHRIILELVEASRLKGSEREEKLREIEQMILRTNRKVSGLREKTNLESLLSLIHI